MDGYGENIESFWCHLIKPKCITLMVSLSEVSRNSTEFHLLQENQLSLRKKA